MAIVWLGCIEESSVEGWEFLTLLFSLDLHYVWLKASLGIRQDGKLDCDGDLYGRIVRFDHSVSNA